MNGLITVGYYTMDHCYGVLQNRNGKWQLISNCHVRHHQFELILNFPGGTSPFPLFPIALDFVLDPAPLPPPASSAYIAITPVLNAPSENSSSQAANPFNSKADMAVVESATEKKPIEISRSKSGSQSPRFFYSRIGTSTVVSNKPIVSQTTEGYKSIYRSTSETILPFIPVICVYFGDGLSPKAFGG